MKKIILWLTSLLALLSLVACSQDVSDPQKDNWKQYEEKQTITIGFDNTFVPMGFEEKDGTYVGFDIDVANALFDLYGITVKWQPIDWDMKETELRNGTIDLIWNGYSATEERRKKVGFTLPYMQNEQVLVTKKSSGIDQVEQMRGKNLGAQIGSSGYDAFEANPALLKDLVRGQKASQYQSFNEALIDLQNDRIDGLLIDRVYANYYLETEGILDDYNVFAVGFEAEDFAVGVRKQDQTLMKKINQGFLTLYQNGQFQQISDKWFGTDVSTQSVRAD